MTLTCRDKKNASIPVLITLCVFLFAGEVLARYLTVAFSLAETQVDVQTPSQLFAKIEWFARHPGQKIAVIGDSVVYGATMGQHGHENWRHDTLSRQLQALYDEETLVMNFGMNGLLPADSFILGKILTQAGADALVVNIGLRAFSADFANPDKAFSRPWLKHMAWQNSRVIFAHEEVRDILHDSALSLEAFLKQNSALYQMLELAQMYLFDGKPHDWIKTTHSQLNAAWQKTNTGLSPDILLQLQTKSRFSTIGLRPDTPQVNALQNILSGEWGIPTVVFYAKENPAQIETLIRKKKFDDFHDALDRLVSAAAASGEHVSYLSAPAELRPEHFLDLVHVNSVGYSIYARAIKKELDKIL